jgi:4-hydroxybenzoate polyprenyltransferase
MVAVWLLNSAPPLSVLILVGLSVGCITAFGNGVNDLMDVTSDRLSHPRRPLPMGRLSPKEAWVVSLFFLGMGLLLAGFLNLAALLFAIGVAALLFLYSWRLKAVILVGNLSVALAAALVFPYGAAAVGLGWGKILYPAIFIFLFHLGREFLKDVMDVAGDERSGLRTLAIAWGPKQTLKAAAIIFWILIPITFIPWFAKIYGSYYLITVLVVDLILVWVAGQIWRSSGALGRYSSILKLNMVFGLIALALGPL